MASLTPIKQRFWNNDGTVAAGGLVYVYLAGTTTPTDSYTDATGSTPNTNPVVLDAKGEASIFTDRQVKLNVLQSDLVQVTGYPMDYTGQVYANLAGSSSQVFSVAPATAAGHAVTLAQFQTITNPTLTLSGSTGDPTTPVTTTAFVSTSGREVTVAAVFSSADTTGASGNLRITGLPAGAVTAYIFQGSVAMSGFGSAPAIGIVNGDVIEVYDAIAITPIAIVAGINKDLRVQLTYFTA